MSIQTIEPIQVDAFCITNAERLDPIIVIFQNYGGGSGRVIVECFGQAWSAYWGAMGSCTVEEFFASSSAGYITEKMINRAGMKKASMKVEYGYLSRIIEAIQKSLKENNGPR